VLPEVTFDKSDIPVDGSVTLIQDCLKGGTAKGNGKSLMSETLMYKFDLVDRLRDWEIHGVKSWHDNLLRRPGSIWTMFGDSHHVDGAICSFGLYRTKFGLGFLKCRTGNDELFDL
jgi:hypothetical protein